jgi:hypothetical protein
MGIEPLEPGFKRFRVRPQAGALEEAKLKLPTPKGPVLLELKGKEAASWSSKLTVPAGTAAEFHLPHAGEPVTSLAGKPATPRVLREEKGRKVLGLGAGTWEISLK